MKLIKAEGAVLDQIIGQSHGIWSDSLTPQNYARYNAAQMRTAWGSRHLRRYALLDDSRQVLSSAKRYDFKAIVDGQIRDVVGIGAVFTPDALRGRGHARRIVDELLTAASNEGAELALLFSEIDPAYYEAMGFAPIRRQELVVRLKEQTGAAMMMVRAGEERDIPAITEVARHMTEGHRFALVPSEDLVRFSLSKKRLLAGFLPAGLLSVEFFVVEEGGRAVAFAILTVTADDVILEMCGDRDPTGARLGALLQVLRARTPGTAAVPISCFLPPGWLPPQLEVESSDTVREVMMVKPLADGVLTSPLRDRDVLYWHGDLF